ncbi:MAG: DsbA family protein [Deltaproteobacteria bacterium]|nr:DsbA family protein [Deltaproteobacteria bacterium]
MAERSSLVRLQKEFDIELDWHGYELHPDTPPGGIALVEKFGPRIHAMHKNLEQFAKGFGVTDMKLRERSPNTRRALAVAEYAREQGKLEAFRQRAMDAHWTQGKDLESDVDLRALATEAGLDPDAAVAASNDPKYLARIDARREQAEEVGITGIPTFVIGNRAVVGCQPYEVLAKFAEVCGAKRKS